MLLRGHLNVASWLGADLDGHPELIPLFYAKRTWVEVAWEVCL